MSTAVRYIWTVTGLRASTNALLDYGKVRYVCEADYDKLEAENAALRADAERHRWLRDEQNKSTSLITCYWWSGLNSKRLDDAIDAARSKA